MRFFSFLPGLFLLSGCLSWDLPNDGYRGVYEPIWDPAVAPVKGGVYVRLPAAHQLVLVKSDGSFATVDLLGASPDRLLVAPDGETVMVYSSWYTCADDDKKIELVYDCPEEDRELHSVVDLVRDGERVGSLDIPAELNSLLFNNTGTLGAAYFNFAEADNIEVEGVLNLSSVVFVDLEEGTTHTVPIGFAAEDVLFSADGGRAVVLSRSQVAVVDLNTFSVSVTYTLSIDADQEVVPTDVVLTEDGRYALVSVNSSDLYILDLEQESIDIVELGATPSDLMVDYTTDQTLIVYSGQQRLDVMEHEYFEITSYELEESMAHIAGGEGMAVLYAVGGNKDVYAVDVTTNDITEFRSENPIKEMFLTADKAIAVATLYPENGSSAGASGFYDQYYGLGIFPVQSGADPIPLVLESEPVGVELVDSNGSHQALVLMSGVDTLLRVDLDTTMAAEVELEEPPVGIDAMPDGAFVVTHDSALGLISFLGADSDEVVTASGFASIGALSEYKLVDREEE